MRQILQNLKSGETELVDVPCPQVKAGHLLIRTSASLVGIFGNRADAGGVWKSQFD